MEVKLYHIVARSNGGTIGNGSDIPWKLPKDLLFFKEKTLNHICIVGRKTYETISHLKNRHFIIITNDENYKGKDGTIVVNTVNDAINKAKEESIKIGQNKVYIIGGAQIYKETFKYVDYLLVTEIEKSFEGTAFYQIPDNFKLKTASELESDNHLIYYFTKYGKI